DINRTMIKGVVRSMKKTIFLSLVLMLTAILAACSNEDSNDDQQHSDRHAPTDVKKLTENDIFSSNKTDEAISEEEMNKAIKKYLDVNSDIIDNKYLIQYKLDKQTGKIGRASCRERVTKSMVAGS